MTEWIKPAERPYWGREDVEWWWAIDDVYRVLTPEERGHKCSIKCPNEAIMVRLEKIKRWDTGTTYDRRSFRCPTHVYGERELQGGLVLVRRARLDLLESA